ncbi:hypothetical protein ARAM_000676, partial [Aspergillus rambellii]
MASHTKQDDFCLECHWESFHLDGKSSEDSSEVQVPVSVSHWDCADGEHHHTFEAHCDVDETCCDADNCSITCPSVCDGFVDCSDSTPCSVAHCEDTNCHDVVPVCFDEHCFDGTGTDPTLESLFGLGIPMSSEKDDLLPAPVEQEDQLSKAVGHPVPDISENQLCTGPFFTPDAIAITHCHPHNFDDLHSHPLPQTTPDSLIQQSLPVQNVNPADVFHMLGMCPDFSNHFHVHEASNCPENLETKLDSSAPNSFTCLHLDEDSVNNLIKNSFHLDGIPARGPCRSNHRCRTHSHPHVHPYSPYSRHSRSSFSSQLLPSPGETPPPLDGGSSVLASPEFCPNENAIHICKWVTNCRGVKFTCGATFPSACALQEHLVSRHMGPVHGAKGTGYYCCWEGCSRPAEPFSQKSKLQGHFLTHSNYKNFQCSVCGKLFARQATLERHERSHRGEKPYKCSDCGKSFTDSSELKTHSRTHTGEKPFKCTFPGCKFQTGD